MATPSGTVVDLALGDGAQLPTPAQHEAVVRVLRTRISTMVVPTASGDMASGVSVTDLGPRKIRIAFDQHVGTTALEKLLTMRGLVSFCVPQPGTHPTQWKVAFALQAGDVASCHAAIAEEPAVIHLRLGARATPLLAHLTTEQNGHVVGVFLDDDLLYAPVVRHPILSGELTLASPGADDDSALVRAAHLMSIDPLPVSVRLVFIKP